MNDDQPIVVRIIDGPHKGDEIILNHMAPSITLIHNTYSIDQGCVCIEYKIDRQFYSNGDFAGYVGRSGHQ